MQGFRDVGIAEEHMVHLLQYSGNNGIVTCNKTLDANCMIWVVTYMPSLGLFEGAVSSNPCSLQEAAVFADLQARQSLERLHK